VVCHPGYVDATLLQLRARAQTELVTLCDPRVRVAVRAAGARVVGFGDLPRLLDQAALAAGGAP
jgi:predicted glycoside hydrolase/deacetylase ChbG (UPF0249 family)